MSKLFISHSSKDDGFVHRLQKSLGYFNHEVWVDSRELRGGDPLWEDIKKGIEEASAYVVVVSPDGLQSKWVGKELRHALDLQKQRGKGEYPIIPLSLDGTKLGVLECYFDEEPLYIAVSSDAGGVDAVIDPLLVALGLRLPHGVSSPARREASLLEELVLELSDLKFQEQDGVRRASARARLVYEPGTPGQREIKSVSSWHFVAPLGPIEAEELRWYLEKFAVWPSEYFRSRASAVEENLVKWGDLLYKSAFPSDLTTNVMNAWARTGDNVARRFSVYVDVDPRPDAPESDAMAAREAGTLVLGLPWELLHNGGGFLFQGARPTRVRRCLPFTRAVDVPIASTPVRILLVTARPEDEACGYIDHRSSALPLVEAMEELGGSVRISVLSPPTLPGLREELDRARRAHEPYHVIHFDGHGVYNRVVGLGGLCFEDPREVGKLERRRHSIVYTNELGPLLREHRIPLVFLDACQSAKAEKASESVASELLQTGVTSVVAMSHSVLIETARRFVEAFYDCLAMGGRVGDAMLEGQRKLKDDTFRGSVFGVGELRLEDWFVPVLFQEKEDLQLFNAAVSSQTLEDLKTSLIARLGELPPAPESGFIGRSRDLLGLERLLSHERHAVIRGQGGEGKTALVIEFARWMVRSHQVRRAVFTSMETHSNVSAVLDAIGRQLVPKFSVATFDKIEKAIQIVERALADESTLIVMDNMESILLPPYLETPEALSTDTRQELEAILTLCMRLNSKGDTRMVFTSREPLPAPFDCERNRRELRQLAREDAIKLVERALNQDAHSVGTVENSAREEIERLVDAVHCHARTLALLSPVLRTDGVETTRASLLELMRKMDTEFPGSRDKSLFASIELSLQRLSPANRDRVQALDLFYGVVNLEVLRLSAGWEPADATQFAQQLIWTGLATANQYDDLILNPALCPYLRGRAKNARTQVRMDRWVAGMRLFVEIQNGLQYKDTKAAEMSAVSTRLNLPNILALLEYVSRNGAPEQSIDLAAKIYDLLEPIAKPQLAGRVVEMMSTASKSLGGVWSHSAVVVCRTRAVDHLSNHRYNQALDEAQRLLDNARAAGESAYPGARYDLAVAYETLGHALGRLGKFEEALSLHEQVQKLFEHVQSLDGAGERMVSRSLDNRGACLQQLGRLDQAAAAHEKAISGYEKAGDARRVAIGKFQLGLVRARQNRYLDALRAYQEAAGLFERMGDLPNLAAIWQQVGTALDRGGKPEAAEDAFRKSLSISIQVGNLAGQASTLNQLGTLYHVTLKRFEQAAAIYGQSADLFSACDNGLEEGLVRNNLAICLRKLDRLEDARREALRSIQCKAQAGYAANIWTTWGILAEIETALGHPTKALLAHRNGMDSFMAYRRAGGENPSGQGVIANEITKQLLAGNPSAALSSLQHFSSEHLPLHPQLRSYFQVLEAIISGDRDRALAETSGLDYMTAVEINLLLEKLEKH
jgi:tetratricopeptide (TPR) repeat protein